MYKNAIKKLCNNTKSRKIAQNGLQINGNSAKFTSGTKINENYWKRFSQSRKTAWDGNVLFFEEEAE